MNTSARLATLSAVLLLGSGTWAQAAEPDTGFYVGAGLTQSRFDSDKFSVNDIDDEDNSWKAIVGLRPAPHFGLEFNYVDFGRSTAPSTSIGGPFSSDADGFALYGVGIMPVGVAELFVKGGAARIDARARQGSGTTAVFYKDKNVQFAYGAGVQFRLGAVGLRAEYEKYDTKVIGDLDLITVGVTFNFGPYQ